MTVLPLLSLLLAAFSDGAGDVTQILARATSLDQGIPLAIWADGARLERVVTDRAAIAALADLGMRSDGLRDDVSSLLVYRNGRGRVEYLIDDGQLIRDTWELIDDGQLIRDTWERVPSVEAGRRIGAWHHRHRRKIGSSADAGVVMSSRPIVQVVGGISNFDDDGRALSSLLPDRLLVDDDVVELVRLWVAATRVPRKDEQGRSEKFKVFWGKLESGRRRWHDSVSSYFDHLAELSSSIDTIRELQEWSYKLHREGPGDANFEAWRATWHDEGLVERVMESYQLYEEGEIDKPISASDELAISIGHEWDMWDINRQILVEIDLADGLVMGEFVENRRARSVRRFEIRLDGDDLGYIEVDTGSDELPRWEASMGGLDGSSSQGTMAALFDAGILLPESHWERGILTLDNGEQVEDKPIWELPDPKITALHLLGAEYRNATAMTVDEFVAFVQSMGFRV